MSPAAVPVTVAESLKDGKIITGLNLVPGSQSRQYHSKIESIYALPADGQEYDRLEQQHRLIMLLFNGPISAPIPTPLPKGFKVLDVGCGPGSWIKDFKRAHPESDAHATDFADTYKPSDEDVTFVHGDILKGLPFEDNTFDFVHMRFFTGALKTAEWPLAIKELHRIVKPGGWVQQVEPDGRLRSEKGVTALIEDWNTRGLRGSLVQRGGEPEAGVKLASLMKAEGLLNVEDKARSAPMNSKVGAVGSHMVKDYQSLISTLAPVLAQSWEMTPEEVVEWGKKVMAESEALEGFHNFHTAVGQKAQ